VGGSAGQIAWVIQVRVGRNKRRDRFTILGNVIAAQFRHVAGSIGSRFLPQCRNRAAWQAAKRRLFRPTA